MGVEGQLLCSPSIFFLSDFISALSLALCKVPLGSFQPQRVTPTRHQAAGRSLDGAPILGLGGGAVTSTFPLKYIHGHVKI